MNNPLWEFAVTTYAHEGVASAALRAQDEAGSDVNLLLYAAWLATQQCELHSEHLADVEASVSPWRRRVVAPLRQLRRGWKGLEEAKPLRETVKSLELRAEQEEVELIWAAHEAATLPTSGDKLLAGNLARVLALTCPDQAQRESLVKLLGAALASAAPDPQG